MEETTHTMTPIALKGTEAETENKINNPLASLSTSVTVTTTDTENKVIMDPPVPSLSGIPNELLREIGSYMNKADIYNLRLVNKRITLGMTYDFAKVIESRPLYPRYECMNELLCFLKSNPVLATYVYKLVLVTEGLKMNEYGYEWAWEQLENTENTYFTTADLSIIDNVNAAHYDALVRNDLFINNGGYCNMLAAILFLLPNVKTIETRKLKPGEHVPGWGGPELVKQLHTYHQGFKTNAIFYGPWRYDTFHHRVTVYTDEFGEEVTEPGAGPQANFFDDLQVAMLATGTTAMIEG